MSAFCLFLEIVIPVTFSLFATLLLSRSTAGLSGTNEVH